MTGKDIVLITGANQGIGFEAVKALIASSVSYHVLLCGRSLERAKEAVESQAHLDSKSTLEALQVDITDDDSISNLFSQVQSSYGKIDVLINNAGASFDHQVAAGNLTIREAWNKAYDVNVSGTEVITHTFMPLLIQSSNPRLLFVTSGLSSLSRASDPDSPRYTVPPAGWPKPPGPSFIAYRSSKTALNMLMLDWARILKNDGVKVWCISPGFLATNLGENREMLKKLGAGEPSIGGEFIRDVVQGKQDENVGKVVSSFGDRLQPW